MEDMNVVLVLGLIFPCLYRAEKGITMSQYTENEHHREQAFKEVKYIITACVSSAAKNRDGLRPDDCYTDTRRPNRGNYDWVTKKHDVCSPVVPHWGAAMFIAEMINALILHDETGNYEKANMFVDVIASFHDDKPSGATVRDFVDCLGKINMYVYMYRTNCRLKLYNHHYFHEAMLYTKLAYGVQLEMKGIIKVGTSVRPTKSPKTSSAKKKKQDDGDTSPSTMEKKDDKTPRGWMAWTLASGWYWDIADAIKCYGFMIKIDEDNPIVKNCCTQMLLFNEYVTRKADDMDSTDVQKAWLIVQEALTVTSGSEGGSVSKKDSLKWVKTFSNNLTTNESKREKAFLINIVLTMALAKMLQAFYNDDKRFDRFDTQTLQNDRYYPITAPAERKEALRTMSYGRQYVSKNWQRVKSIKPGVIFRFSDIMMVLCGENFRFSLSPAKTREKMARQVRTLRNSIQTESRQPGMKLPWMLDIEETAVEWESDDKEDEVKRMKPAEKRDYIVGRLLEKVDAAEMISLREQKQHPEQSKRIVAVLTGLIELFRNECPELLSKKKRTEINNLKEEIEQQEESTDSPHRGSNLDVKAQYWSEDTNHWVHELMSEMFNTESKGDTDDTDEHNLGPKQMIEYVKEYVTVWRNNWIDPDKMTRCRVILAQIKGDNREEIIEETLQFFKLGPINNNKTYPFQNTQKWIRFHANYEITAQDGECPPRVVTIAAKQYTLLPQPQELFRNETIQVDNRKRLGQADDNDGGEDKTNPPNKKQKKRINVLKDDSDSKDSEKIHGKGNGARGKVYNFDILSLYKLNVQLILY